MYKLVQTSQPASAGVPAGLRRYVVGARGENPAERQLDGATARADRI